MNLVEIITNLLTVPGRASYELPRGLWLVYYPPAAEDQPGRLIAGRHLIFPSTTELRVVRTALLEALDRTPSRVLVDIDEEWPEIVKADWHGYAIDFHTLPAAAAFSHDPDLRHAVRLGIEQREQRELKRRAATRGTPAANRGRKPML